MPKVPQKDSNRLSTKDIAAGDMLVITGPGKLVNFNQKDAQNRIVEVKTKIELIFTLPDGTQKTWALNNKSSKNLVKAWGDNSDAWDGKTVMVAIEDSPQYGEFIVLFPTKTKVDRGAGVTEEPLDDNPPF